MKEIQSKKLSSPAKDVTSKGVGNVKSSKGKPGGPTDEDRMKYGRNMSRAKNQGN